MKAAEYIKSTDLQVIIPDATYQKVMYFVRKTNFEISGFAHVVFDPEKKTLTVGEPYLCKQENHATETEMDAQSINKAQFEMFQRGEQLRWWWHSHVNMGVFWSGTDMSTIEDLGGNGWILATVFNKKAEMKSALLTTYESASKSKTVTGLMGETESETTQTAKLFIDDIPTVVERYLNLEEQNRWDAEYTNYVTEKTYKYVSSYTSPGKVYDYSGSREDFLKRESEFLKQVETNQQYGKGKRKGKKGSKKKIDQGFRVGTSFIELGSERYYVDEINQMAAYFGMPVGEYIEWVRAYGDETDDHLEWLKDHGEYTEARTELMDAVKKLSADELEKRMEENNQIMALNDSIDADIEDDLLPYYRDEDPKDFDNFCGTEGSLI